MPLSVIGAGFGRTGTMSLKLALDRLGFGPCYHMVEVFKNPKASSYWEAAADGKPVDWASATFYKQLANAYPEAKVILTVRDPEAWFASTQATIFSRHIRDDTEDDWQRMVLKVISDLFDRRMTDKGKLIEVYQGHNEEVRRTISKERLLVYEVADGWEPLCGFLDVEVPNEPMPRANSTDEFRQNLAAKLAENADRS
jgi:hypothetical protein